MGSLATGPTRITYPDGSVAIVPLTYYDTTYITSLTEFIECVTDDDHEYPIIPQPGPRYDRRSIVARDAADRLARQFTSEILPHTEGA